MSIRDIIDKATHEYWARALSEVDSPSGMEIAAAVLGEKAARKEMAEVFDPEHVALMESLVEGFTYSINHPDEDSDWPYHAHERLMAYRKERGL